MKDAYKPSFWRGFFDQEGEREEDVSIAISESLIFAIAAGDPYTDEYDDLTTSWTKKISDWPLWPFLMLLAATQKTQEDLCGEDFASPQPSLYPPVQ